jgi:hypothetical protein
MREIAAVTIFAKKHLALARVVADSFRRHHPGIPFFALLADESDGYTATNEQNPFGYSLWMTLSLRILAAFGSFIRNKN